METILDKYDRIRPSLRGGELFLIEGIRPISDVIRSSDDCKYTHVLLVVKMYDTFYCVDSNATGVKPDRLSFRMASYMPDGNFTVKRSTKKQREIDIAVATHLKNTDYEIKYDYWNGFKSLLNRKFKLNLSINPKKDRMICSEFVRPYAVALEMIYNVEIYNSLFFPQDYIRYEYLVKTIE
jgi:hypothetical protein